MLALGLELAVVFHHHIGCVLQVVLWRLEMFERCGLLGRLQGASKVFFVLQAE